jgi:outer membrane biosynthesis protein TonB
MRNTELIIFVLVVLINGGIALWKKYAEVKAKRAAEALARPGGMARASMPRPVPTATPKQAPPVKAPAKPKPKPRAKPKPKPKSRPVPPVAAATRASVAPAPKHAPGAVAVALAPSRAAPAAARLQEASGARLIVGRRGLRRAMVLREILGPPRALAPWQA